MALSLHNNPPLRHAGEGFQRTEVGAAAKGTWQAKHVPPEGYSQRKLTLSILVLLHVLDQERAELTGRDGELAPFVPGNDLGPGDKGL